MRNLYYLFSLLVYFLPASAENQWLFYKHFPWVYDNINEDWLYLRGSENGLIYAYNNKTKEWQEFSSVSSAKSSQKSWETMYDSVWMPNPEPYGGEWVLQELKNSRDYGDTNLYLEYENISDLAPFAGLNQLESLGLKGNNIIDVTPLSGLTGLRELILWENQISDLSPLAALINLESLDLDDNNISDVSALIGLVNLQELYLVNNPISVEQKQILENALPNTTIYW